MLRFRVLFGFDVISQRRVPIFTPFFSWQIHQTYRFRLLDYQASSISTDHRSLKNQIPQLTASRYPYLKPDRSFAKVGDGDISYFERILDKHQVVTDTDELLNYNVDWMEQWRGCGQLVLRPKNTDEVAAILQYCDQRKLAVCPQGGNTGLVGGSVPVFDEIVISTSLMNKVVELDDVAGTLICEAGCILETLDTYVAKHGLIIPFDLGARGTCQIGGNISTNAGGLRLLRYGSLHANILGLKAVLADGQILDCMSTLRKDNTGFNLKHLFVGAEGTLGIITEVALQCPTRPSTTCLVFLGCKDFDCVVKSFVSSKRFLGEILSSFELMDQTAIQHVEKATGLKCPLQPIEEHTFFVLVEASGSCENHDTEKMENFMKHLLDEGIISDGVFVAQPSHITEVWAVRERISEAMKLNGHVYKYDLSLPLDCFYSIVPELRIRLGSQVHSVSGYGHVGDGNLHLNVVSEKYDPEVERLLEPHVFDWVSQHGGSISAEHGIGLQKRNYIQHTKSSSAVSLMQHIKKLLDPKGILNPYKLFPDI